MGPVAPLPSSGWAGTLGCGQYMFPCPPQSLTGSGAVCRGVVADVSPGAFELSPRPQILATLAGCRRPPSPSPPAPASAAGAGKKTFSVEGQVAAGPQSQEKVL